MSLLAAARGCRGGHAGAQRCGPPARPRSLAAPLSSRRCWHVSAARQLQAAAAGARHEARPDTPNDDASRRVPFLTRAANNALKVCKTLPELQACLYEHADVLDYVCISTSWVRLGKVCADAEETAAGSSRPPPERLEQGRAFAREVLLGKTLKYLPLMGVRQVSNTLWGMGKARLQLAAEGDKGTYLAAAVEERLLELLAKPGLHDARNAEQLWLGLRFCKYGWSDRLLRALADATLAKVVEWSGDVKALCQICDHVPHLLEGRVALTKQQRAALAEAIRRAVSSPDSNQQDLQLGCVSLMYAGAELDLPLDASTAQRLHGLVLARPLTLTKAVGLAVPASYLINATRLGYQPTAAEAQAWLQRFQDLTGRSTDTWSAEEFGYVVGALSSCRAFKPPREMLARLRKEARQSVQRNQIPVKGTLPWRLQLACKAWGVAF